jgi:phospholipid/cholesterol/gamma-HCH transport system ATP-binding protein
MISIRSVSKSFGAQVVLDGIDLEIAPGMTTAIVGPSGVGKSVLLKLIMGIMDVDSGQIEVGGASITSASSEREKARIRSSLGVLFQSAALFDSLTVYDNVAFPLLERRIKGQKKVSRSEVHKRVMDTLEALSLTRYTSRYIEEISLGVRKRVGMARALITEPKILLFDEPNTGLDPLDGQEVYDLIKECKERWGFTGVVISHEIPEVFQVSDRVAMLLGGKIIEEGPPKELSRSSHPAVKQFLEGSINGPIKIQ